MFTALKTIPQLEGKPRELRVLFADTANEALLKGRSTDEAIFKGLALVKQAEQKTIKKFVKPAVPRHLQAILDIRNNPQAYQEAPQEPEIAKANLPLGNDVVGAQFDAKGRLILKLADGKTIVSNVAPITAVETNVVVIGENGQTVVTGTGLDHGVDGGSASSVFKVLENVDGGAAANVVQPSESIDGGTLSG